MITKQQINEIMNVVTTPCFDSEYCGNEKITRACRSAGCGVAHAVDILNSLKEDIKQSENAEIVEEGCWLCDQYKDILYDSNRGGFKVANYCPNCGKKLN